MASADCSVKTTEEQHRKADAEADELEHKARRTLTLSGTDTAKASAMTAKWKVANKRAEESEALFEELENKVSMIIRRHCLCCCTLFEVWTEKKT